MSTPLTDIFNSPEETQTAETESAETVETETTGEEVTTEQPATATEETTETTDSPPESQDTVDDFSKQIKAFEVKAADETRKRQELQRQLEAIQQQKTQVEKPDAFAQPDEAIAHAIASVEQKFQNQLLNLSENGARERHSDDFDTMKDMFFDKMVIENPALQAEALAQVDPYEFIYRTAKNQSELSQITELGGVEAMREKIAAEERAKLKAEMEAEKKAEIEKALNGVIPNSLSGQRAAGGNQGQTYSGPTPLSKIVGK